ncbi:MAG: peptide chain release factor 1 [Acidimicrobiia bacterium]
MDDALRSKLEDLERALAETVEQMGDPALVTDQERFVAVGRRHSELKPVVEAFHAYSAAAAERTEAIEMAGSETEDEMKEYLDGVARDKSSEMDELDASIRRLLIPKDPLDDKNVIMEVRSAAGGDEAALWAGDLFRMYQRYAERHDWAIEPMDTSLAEGGGIKEATFAIKGKGAYSRLKFEAGAHRVQRVPTTESSGRIHTSMATVAVLPEVEAVEIDVHENDIIVDVYRSSGPGGQSVNTTDSAVRLTHKPTGLIVTCQDEKSQLQNKEKAMRVLRARLYQIQIEEQMGERAESRKAQVGTGERSEKIRTYNFRENRVTDHRINMTIKRLPEILEGDLDDFIEALMADDETHRLMDED